MASQDGRQVWKLIKDVFKKAELNYILQSGLYVYPEPQSFFYYSIGTIIISLGLLCSAQFLLIMTIVKAKDNMMLVCELLVYISMLFPASVVLPVMIIKRSEFTNILIQLNKGVYKYSGQETEKIQQLRREGEMNINITCRLFKYFILSLLISFAVASPLSYYLDLDSKTYVNPEITFGLPVPLWFPLDTNNTYGYIIAFTYLSACGFVIFQLVVAFDPFFVFICVEITTELKILTYSIESIQNRVDMLYSDVVHVISKNGQKHSHDVVNTCVSYCFKENILHYNAICQFYKSVEGFFSLCLLVLCGSNMICLGTTAYILSKEPSIFSFEAYKFCSFLFAEIIHASFYCWFGTMITTESENFSQSLYKCPWIKFSQPVKQSFKIFQLRATKPIILTMIGVFPLNLNTLVQILKNTYSLYNLLLNTNA